MYSVSPHISLASAKIKVFVDPFTETPEEPGLRHDLEPIAPASGHLVEPG